MTRDASEDAEPAGRSQPSAQPEAAAERYGTVAVARHVKDDGRALILYRHASAEPR
jgi:hypothetical protein